MKLTKETLKKIIKEELEAVLGESALLRKFNKDKKEEFRQYLQDMGKDPDALRGQLGHNSYNVMGQSLVHGHPGSMTIPRGPKINHRKDPTGKMILDQMDAYFIFSVIEDSRIKKITDFDYGTIDVMGYYYPGSDRDPRYVHLVIEPQIILDPDTNEPLEYDFDKQFTIQIEGSEDYYDPNIETQEEMAERLKFQLQDLYG